MTELSAIGALAQRVTATVRDAAARTGSDFSYLLAQARLESGLDPAAAAPTSSARGLFQFTNATWLDIVRKHGAEHGLGWAADALKSGVAEAGSAVRDAILSLRTNAEAASLMAGEFARDNAQGLEHRLGRAANATELYLAHFLGAGGAAKFLGAMASAPGTAAASLLPAAARANPGVFYAHDGSPRSLAEVHDRFAAKLAASGVDGSQSGSSQAGAINARTAGGASLDFARDERGWLPPPVVAAGSGQSLPPAGQSTPQLAATTAAANRVELARLLLADLGG